MLGSKFPSARKKTKLDKIDNIFESIVIEDISAKTNKNKQVFLLPRLSCSVGMTRVYSCAHVIHILEDLELSNVYRPWFFRFVFFCRVSCDKIGEMHKKKKLRKEEKRSECWEQEQPNQTAKMRSQVETCHGLKN